jgi:hypothetical protein
MDLTNKQCRTCGKTERECDAMVWAAVNKLSAKQRQDDAIRARTQRLNTCCPSCNHVV